MKINDCWRLAKISLQARKKATRNTICGMVVSLVIIIPLIFATIGLNLSVKSELNSHPELLYASFHSEQSGFKLDKSIDEYNLDRRGNNYDPPHRSRWKDRSADFKQLENETFNYVSVVADIDNWYSNYNESIHVNGGRRGLKKFENIVNKEYSALAIAAESCVSKFSSSKYNFLKAPYNKGFTGNGARQVILSERYLAMAGLQPQDVYGKKVTIKIKEHHYISSTNNFYFKTDGNENLVDSVEYNLFEEFEVVGITTNKLWYNSSTESGFDEIDDDHWRNYYTGLENANIIVSGASYYGNDGKPAIDHEFYVDENGEKLICDFGNLQEKNAMTKDFVFCGANGYNPYYIEAERENWKYTGKMNCVQVNYYKYYPENDSTDSYDQITAILEKAYPFYSDEYKSFDQFRLGGYTARMYSEFAVIDFFISSILMILSIFSIIILLTALINLFNTIMHSVQSRKNYLGVMRAVGAKSKDIPKLYFFEVIRMICIAFAWIACIGIALCIVVKIVIDKIFTSAIGGYAKIITISLPWYLIPIVILAIMAILFVVGLIFALGCSVKIAYKPIVESLEEGQ